MSSNIEEKTELPPNERIQTKDQDWSRYVGVDDADFHDARAFGLSPSSSPPLSPLEHIDRKKIAS